LKIKNNKRDNKKKNKIKGNTKENNKKKKVNRNLVEIKNVGKFH